MLPQNLNSNCQNALIFHGINLSNTTAKYIRQSVKLARLRNFIKRFTLISSYGPDWKVKKGLFHSYIKNRHIINWSSFHFSHFSNCITCWLAQFSNLFKLKLKYFVKKFSKQVWYLMKPNFYKYNCTAISKQKFEKWNLFFCILYSCFYCFFFLVDFHLYKSVSYS